MTTPSAPQPEGTPPVGERRCGRCRRTFEGDPTLAFQTDWALCPDCQEKLLPQKSTFTPEAG